MAINVSDTSTISNITLNPIAVDENCANDPIVHVNFINDSDHSVGLTVIPPTPPDSPNGYPLNTVICESIELHSLLRINNLMNIPI